MTMWKRICCPVDFSPVSRRAADEAAELGWRFGARITLLHVVEPEPAAAPAPSPAPPPERERSLEAWRNAVDQIATTRVDTAFAAGDAASEIVRFVEEHGYDVIVMGTHGAVKGPLGSVAAKVVLESRCPVIVVPEAPRARVE